jgi:hypothetical protein
VNNFSGGQCFCTAEKFWRLTIALRTQHHALILGSPSQPPNEFGTRKFRHRPKIEKLPTKSVLLVGFGGIDAPQKKCAKMKAPKTNRLI